jgi:hypothetical protein
MVITLPDFPDLTRDAHPVQPSSLCFQTASLAQWELTPDEVQLECGEVLTWRRKVWRQPPMPAHQAHNIAAADLEN